MGTRLLISATMASTLAGLKSGRAAFTRPRRPALMTWRRSAITTLAACPCPWTCCPLPLAPAAEGAGETGRLRLLSGTSQGLSNTTGRRPIRGPAAGVGRK
ncbi:hypothetical protein V8C86DRAFT_2473697, partial [Haematococcus lacustris]